MRHQTFGGSSGTNITHPFSHTTPSASHRYVTGYVEIPMGQRRDDDVTMATFSTTSPRPFFVVLTKLGYFNNALEYVYKVWSQMIQPLLRYSQLAEGVVWPKGWVMLVGYIIRSYWAAMFTH